MKKIICLIITVAACLQMTGCHPLRPEPEGPKEEALPPTPQPSEKAESVSYDTIIRQYKTAVSEGWSTERMMETGLNYMIPGCLQQDERARVGYYEGDINGDGRAELAIAASSESEYYTGMIFALYDMADGQPSLLVESTERDRWYYAGDGILCNEASGSAAEFSASLCSADRELAFLEAIEHDTVQYPEDPWLRFDGENWNHIPEEDAESGLMNIKGMVRNMNLIEFDSGHTAPETHETPVIAPTERPAEPKKVKITKSPSGETVEEGGKAIFIAKAENAEKTVWILVSPDTKTTYRLEEGPEAFPGLTADGQGTEKIHIGNIPYALNGWRVQCYFEGNGGPLYTSGAYLNVSRKTQPDKETAGPDVAEIVNLRGDETTVYKLADGSYMDRTERKFTFNGTDTWTDENGAEWNRTVP